MIIKKLFILFALVFFIPTLCLAQTSGNPTAGNPINTSTNSASASLSDPLNLSGAKNTPQIINSQKKL